MATETGIKLLSALRAAGSTSSLREVPSQFMEGDDERGALEWLKEWVSQYRNFPSPATFRQHTGIQTVRTNEPLAYYVGQARKRCLYHLQMQPYAEMREAMEAMDPDTVQRLAQQILTLGVGLQASASDYVTLEGALHEVLADFSEARLTTGLRGIPTYWEYTNEITGGWQDDDLISIVGRPGAGKTYIMLLHAYAAWRAGHSVLFNSNELGALQLGRRLFGLHARINPTLLRTGRVSTHISDQFEGVISGMCEGVPFNIIQGGLRRSVETVQAVAEATNPDILFCDASYLLKPATKRRGSEGRREMVGDTIEDLKRLNGYIRRPIVQSVQFNRQATASAPRQRGRRGENTRVLSPTAHLGLEKIGETDIIGQVSSVVIGVAAPFQNYPQDTRDQRFLKGREGEAGIFRHGYQFDPPNFDFLQMVNEVSEEQEEQQLEAVANMI